MKDVSGSKMPKATSTQASFTIRAGQLALGGQTGCFLKFPYHDEEATQDPEIPISDAISVGRRQRVPHSLFWGPGFKGPNAQVR